jgi:DinB superfamily
LLGGPAAARRSIARRRRDDQGPDAGRSILAEAGDLLRKPPEPGEWSVLECIAHLADSELIASARYRWILAEDEPDIVGYDQDLWVTGLRQRDDDPETLVGAFAALRRWNLELWASRPASDRDRVGRHRERGLESYGLTFRLAAGHDRIHLAQAKRALETVRKASVGTG